MKTHVNLILGVLLISSLVDVSAMGVRNKQKEVTAGEYFRGVADQRSAVDSVVEGQQSPVQASASGTNNSVTVFNVPSDTYKATIKAQNQSDVSLQERNEYSSKSEVRLPIGVAIFIGCLGLSMLCVAYILFTKLTKVGKASDAFASNIIDNIDTRLATETNPGMIASLMSLKAQAEKGRGKMKNL